MAADGCRWLTSDHDFLREIVVIYSLNFCFCYCCSSFATALVAVGLFCCCFWFSVFGFRYYLYFCCCDCCCCCSCSFFPYILNKHTYEACKKYFLHEVPATMPQKFNAKSTSSPSERSISVRRLRQTTQTHSHIHTHKPSEHTHNVAIDWQNMRQPKRDVGKQCEIVLPIHRSDRTWNYLPVPLRCVALTDCHLATRYINSTVSSVPQQLISQPTASAEAPINIDANWNENLF